MQGAQAAPTSEIQTLKNKTYTAQVKDLLITSQLSAMEIAEICGCSYQLVTFCRRQLNLPHSRQTQQQMLSRLQREVQESRRGARIPAQRYASRPASGLGQNISRLIDRSEMRSSP